MQWKNYKMKKFDFKKLTSDPMILKIVGASLKQGKQGQYLHVTARSQEDNSMPSVRALCATEWRADLLLASCGLKRKPDDPKDLIGLEFTATIVHHIAPNKQDFIDVLNYK